MRVLALIPARGGSKGILRKNIKLLHGKPLIQYTLEQAERVGLFTRIIVSTEDDEIASVCASIGFPLDYKRPASLAEDSTPTLPVILHVLEEEKKLGREYDAICLLQTTSPFRSDEIIKAAVDKMKQEPCLDAVISMKEVPSHYHPSWLFKQTENGQIQPYEKGIPTQRQLLKPVYYRDGAVYLTKTDCLIMQESLFGEQTGMVINNKVSVNLDTMEDWCEAEKLMG
jgi:CMP-N,N'-diacetyllegionaminic acid synthase